MLWYAQDPPNVDPFRGQLWARYMQCVEIRRDT